MSEFTSVVTISLMILIASVSILAFNNRKLYERFKHYPFLEKTQHSYYRWITCGFIHADWFHLAMNLFVLMQFGIVVENICKEKAGIGPGSLIYLIAYLFILIASNIPTFLKNKENPYYASIGASGAISGILFIYIVFNPFRLLLLFGMFPLPGIAMGLLYLFYSRWASTHGKDHIDHDAHYYGALLGIIAGVLIKYLI